MIKSCQTELLKFAENLAKKTQILHGYFCNDSKIQKVLPIIIESMARTRTLRAFQQS
jgi:hypothetical protein